MRVLVADDDPISRQLLQVALSNSGYEPTMVMDGAEVLRILSERDSPKLMVLDWMMPHVNGVEVCRAIRNTFSEHYVYLILLTVKGKQEEIVEGLEAGADDYITKPFDLHELRARLRAGKRILDLQDQLVAQATHDSLTGFLNRKAIFDKLRVEVVRAARERTALSVIMADIDHFKLVNDAYGHSGGDAVLREVSRRILASVRSYDSVGRYGGEEFLIVAPGCPLPEAVQLAERLRKCVSDVPIAVAGGAVATTISMGASDTTAGQKADDMLRSADRALYAAKSGGRNRVESNRDSKIAVPW